jgi:predicted nuclease of restriction endonuclease-like (RecB) superfamily
MAARKIVKAKSHALAKRATPTRAPQRKVRVSVPSRSTLPSDYGRVLDDLKRRTRDERVRTVLAANSAMVLLYWDIGSTILARQEAAGWGAKIIDRLSQDLRRAYPEMQGLSLRNMLYMRAFATAWPRPAIVQAPLAQLPWYHHIALIERVKQPEERLWYAQQAATLGWSRNILALQIDQQAHSRHGRTVHNFKTTLPPAESDMASQIFKDPYLFDFIGTADPRREREVEQALTDHIQNFLLELGAGFAFVGRQVSLEVGSQNFMVDLLFYHLKLRCYVVIELKAVPFEPAFVGQINLYLAAVDDLMRHPDDRPTIGLVLCRSKDRVVAEYALRNLVQPIGVADWETGLAARLPKELKGSLPTIQELEAEFAIPAAA